MLSAQNISKTFRGSWGQKPVAALTSACLELKCGETLGLMGPSGCGKTTLARIILRLIPADSGEVWYRGQNITQLKRKQLLPFRREVQLISQHPVSFFNPSIKLGSSLLEPLKIFGIYEKKAATESVRQMLEQVKLDRLLLDRYPHQVSGGEIQRLAICRALLLRPKVLVLDEPTSMLDVSVQAQILHLLRELQREQRLSYLFISHDSSVVHWLSDRVVRMSSGGVG